MFAEGENVICKLLDDGTEAIMVLDKDSCMEGKLINESEWVVQFDKTTQPADEESASGVQSPVTPHPPVILQPASIASMPSTSAQHAASVADKKDKDIWSAAETEFLLNKYEASTELVGPTKKFRYKKEMWDQLAKELNMVFSTRKTGRQCENRLKTLKRRKTDTTQSKTSGNSHSIVEDGEESLEPEILARPCEVVLSSVGKALSAGASNRLVETEDEDTLPCSIKTSPSESASSGSPSVCGKRSRSASSLTSIINALIEEEKKITVIIKEFKEQYDADRQEKRKRFDKNEKRKEERKKERQKWHREKMELERKRLRILESHLARK